jgi:4-amino-4-deoxy-L-arabinose transferase-like glycosyltransferase
VTGAAGGRRAAGAAGMLAGTAPPGGWPLAVWLAVLAVALIARLAFVAVVPRIIEWPDGREYEQVARLLVEHGTYGLQTLRAPGYPTFIAAVYRVFGENLTALRLVEAVLGTITVGLLGLVGSRLFGRGAGLATAILTALHPVLAFMPATQFTENTLALVIALALGAAFTAVRSRRLRWWAAMGALLGVATLIRPNVIVLFPGLALGLAGMLLRERRTWLVPLVVSAAVLVLALAPWMVRNHQVHGRWFFITTGGGRQIWMGNNPWTDCASWKHSVPDSAMLAEMGRLPNEIARDRYLYGKAVEFMRQSPARAAQLYLVKLGNIYALYPEPFSETHVTASSRWAQGFASAIVFAGALLALGRWRAQPGLWPLVAGVVSFTLPNAVVLTGMRYRLAIEPCLLLMAGLGWASVLDMVARRRWRPIRNSGAEGAPGASPDPAG